MIETHDPRKEAFEENKRPYACPICHDTKSTVAETRAWKGVVIRVRRCSFHDHRYYTMEMEGQGAFELYQEYNTAYNQSRKAKPFPEPTKPQLGKDGLIKSFGGKDAKD